MMPSSPPTRAWDRPLSPAGSEYSLDLGALDLDGHSNASSPLPKPHVDRVMSEDIEGPSDFTLNLEKWMNGGTLGKSTMRSARKPLQSLKEQDVNARDGRASRQHLHPPVSPQKTEEERTVSHHTPSDTPPKESVWMSEPAVRDGADRDDGEEHGSSDWDPYEEGQTPHPPAHQQPFLQPTVEEYYSELTPARVSRGPIIESPQQQYPQIQESPDQRADSHAQVLISRSRMSDTSTPGRPSSPTLSPVRSPVMKRSGRLSSPFTEPRASRGPPSHANADTRFQQLELRCQQLIHLNIALKQALDEEKRIRGNEKLAHEAHVANTARREQDLTELKDQAYTRITDFRTEFTEQKDRLRVLEAQAGNQKVEAERLSQQHREEVGVLRDELDELKKVHEREVQVIEQDLQLEQRSRDDAEENARVLREEAEERKENGEMEVQRLRLEVRQAGDARASVVGEYESRLETARQEAVQLTAAKVVAEDESTRLRAKVAELRLSRESDTDRTSTVDHQRAVELGESLQTKLRDLQQQLRDEQAMHDAEIARLRDSHDADDGGIAATEECEALRTEVDSLRGDIEAEHSLLNSAILERDEAVDSLSDLQNEHDALQESHTALTTSHSDLQNSHQTLSDSHTLLQTRIADFEAINSAVDAEVAELVKEREAVWRKRLEASEVERKTMAKALMHSWGREEVGGLMAPRQGFEYRMVARGDGGSPVKTGT